MSFEIKRSMIRSFLRKTAWQHTPIMWHMRMKQKQKKKEQLPVITGWYLEIPLCEKLYADRKRF